MISFFVTFALVFMLDGSRYGEVSVSAFTDGDRMNRDADVFLVFIRPGYI